VIGDGEALAPVVGTEGAGAPVPVLVLVLVPEPVPMGPTPGPVGYDGGVGAALLGRY
jgi:hypothetical protein